jgi:hypothetical protein
MQSAFHRMSTLAMVKGTRNGAAEHDSETVSTGFELVAWRVSEAMSSITSCNEITVRLVYVCHDVISHHENVAG